MPTAGSRVSRCAVNVHMHGLRCRMHVASKGTVLRCASQRSSLLRTTGSTRSLNWRRACRRICRGGHLSLELRHGVNDLLDLLVGHVAVPHNPSYGSHVEAGQPVQQRLEPGEELVLLRRLQLHVPVGVALPEEVRDEGHGLHLDLRLRLLEQLLRLRHVPRAQLLQLVVAELQLLEPRHLVRELGGQALQPLVLGLELLGLPAEVPEDLDQLPGTCEAQGEAETHGVQHDVVQLKPDDDQDKQREVDGHADTGSQVPVAPNGAPAAYANGPQPPSGQAGWEGEEGLHHVLLLPLPHIARRGVWIGARARLGRHHAVAGLLLPNGRRRVRPGLEVGRGVRRSFEVGRDNSQAVELPRSLAERWRLHRLAARPRGSLEVARGRPHVAGIFSRLAGRPPVRSLTATPGPGLRAAAQSLQRRSAGRLVFFHQRVQDQRELGDGHAVGAHVLHDPLAVEARNEVPQQRDLREEQVRLLARDVAGPVVVRGVELVRHRGDGLELAEPLHVQEELRHRVLVPAHLRVHRLQAIGHDAQLLQLPLVEGKVRPESLQLLFQCVHHRFECLEHEEVAAQEDHHEERQHSHKTPSNNLRPVVISYCLNDHEGHRDQEQQEEQKPADAASPVSRILKGTQLPAERPAAGVVLGYLLVSLLQALPHGLHAPVCNAPGSLNHCLGGWSSSSPPAGLFAILNLLLNRRGRWWSLHAMSFEPRARCSGNISPTWTRANMA
mmetsp:Transcript_17338/g.52259  ORF Transcript_17338/g.52259 Transcript_17338/m.52259 type:complete len:725 (+) Transcript_17338:161-2335(+)